MHTQPNPLNSAPEPGSAPERLRTRNISRVETAAKRSVGRPKVREKVIGIVLEILDAPDAPIWTKRIELQLYVRRRGMQKHPNDFDGQRPNNELLRKCISEALKQRDRRRV